MNEKAKILEVLHDSLGVDYRASELFLVACDHIYSGEALAASINTSYVGFSQPNHLFKYLDLYMLKPI